MITQVSMQEEDGMDLLEAFQPIPLSVPPRASERVPVVVTMADLLESSVSVPPSRLGLQPTATRERPMKGAIFAGARLEREIRCTTRVVSWAGRDGKGKPVAVHLPCSHAVGVELEAFMDNAKRLAKLSREDHVSGVAAVLSIADDHRAFATPLFEIGTMRDLPVLGWPIDRLKAFFGTLVGIVQQLHERGLYVGCLSPDDVLVDDDLEPVLMWAGAVTSARSPVFAADVKYAAPELSSGNEPDELTDVHALGRLFEVLVGDWLATTTDEATEAIRSLIVKSTAFVPSLRFSSLGDLLAEVERATKRANTGAVNMRAGGRPRARRAASVDIAPATAAPRPARNRLASFYVVEEDRSDRPLRPGWVGVGVAGVAAACGIAFAVPLSHAGGVATSCAGAVLGAVAAGALPTPHSLRRAGRPIFALGAAVILFWLDPTAWLSHTAADRRIHSTNQSVRSAEIQRAVDRPRADLCSLDLQGLDLRGKNLVEADLRGTILRDADLTGATIRASDVAEADMTGAILDGATLTGLDVVATTGFNEAHCSDATILPSGWVCRDAHPKPDNSNNVEESAQ